jgi:DNA-binding beta-propeller fold protein YncE
MRRSPAIVLVLLVSGCAAGTNPSQPGSAMVSAPASQQVAPSASIQRNAPDWSAIPTIRVDVASKSALAGGWSALLGAAPLAHGSVWISNGGEGEPPKLRRLDPETLRVTAVVDLGGEQDVFPPDAYGAARSADGIWVPLGYQKAVVLVDPATNSVSRRIEVDANPYGLLEDGDDLWITDFSNSEVLRVDLPSGEERLRLDVPDPTWMASGPEGLWVIEHQTGFVTRLDPVTGNELARVHVGGRPCIALGLGSVWSGSADEKTVARIDPATNRVVATIELPSNGCGGALADGSVWVAVGPQRGPCERTSYLVRIDPALNEIDGIVGLPCVGVVASDGSRLWLSLVERDVTSISIFDAGA